MNDQRRVELLAYAEVCFRHCTNPFDHTHLQKKKVNADECRDLSNFIASIVEDELFAIADHSRELIYTDVVKAQNRAKEDFEETQQ